MRKKLSLLALLVLALCGISKAQDYDFSAVTSSGHTLYYNIVSGGVEVTYPNYRGYGYGDYWYNTTKPTGDLVIDSIVINEGTGTTYTVAGIRYYAFYGCTELTSVTIPNSVTSIGSSAFNSCTGLTSVSYNATNCTSAGSDDYPVFGSCYNITSFTMGNSVQTIPAYLCYGCTGLTSITIPNTVNSIGEGAFSGCTGLTSVIYNATYCSSAGNRSYPVFSSCPNITSVTIGNNVQTIPNYLFYGCTGLTSVSLGNGVATIGDGAFSGCNSLTSVNIPNATTTIGSSAFYGCTSLTSASLGNGVTSIGNDAFSGCSDLSSIIIPDATTTIGGYAFYGCTDLTSVSLGNGVTSIDDNAFNGCSSLISINIPNATTTIGNSAFNGCTSLTSATIGDGVTSIGDNAFTGCLRLTSVRLGEGVINIGSQAFKDCGIIGELVIPQSVTTIGHEGFRNCYGINEITCLGRVAPTLDYDVFRGLDTSITVNIPCGTTNLYAGRWSYFHNFNEIPFLFNVVSDNLAYGTVQMLQEPSCDDPVAIVKATARSGYHFDHWSDGSTQNPYTCVVTGSMTLTAFFASDNGQTGIETADGDVTSPNIYADGGRIVVTGAEDEEVCLYDMMGRRLASRQGEDVHFDVPAAGIYLVRIGDRAARKVVVVR